MSDTRRIRAVGWGATKDPKIKAVVHSVKRRATPTRAMLRARRMVAGK